MRRRSSPTRLGDRHDDRLLLRADRLRVHLVLPQDLARQRPRLLDAGRHPDTRRADPVLRSRLEPARRLAGTERCQHGYTGWTMPFSPHWTIGGIFLIGIGTFLIGIILMFTWRAISPPFFRGETLTRTRRSSSTATSCRRLSQVAGAETQARGWSLARSQGRARQRPSSRGRVGSQAVPPAASRRRRAIADSASSTTRLASAAVMSAWSYGGETSTTSMPHDRELETDPAHRVEQLAGRQPAGLRRAGAGCVPRVARRRCRPRGRRRRSRRPRSRTPRSGTASSPRVPDLAHLVGAHAAARPSSRASSGGGQ